jgi:hypothetical protein
MCPIPCFYCRSLKSLFFLTKILIVTLALTIAGRQGRGGGKKIECFERRLPIHDLPLALFTSPGADEGDVGRLFS